MAKQAINLETVKISILIEIYETAVENVTRLYYAGNDFSEAECCKIIEQKHRCKLEILRRLENL